MKALRCVSAVLAIGLFCPCSAIFAQAGSEVPANPPRSQPQAAKPSRLAAPAENTVVIPGPLRSFLRMAGISQQIAPEQVLPLVARNAYSTGYVNGVPTEYLRLLDRYLHQARELQMLAGSNGVIRVTTCAEAEPLLSILGYHARPGCGQRGSTLLTAEPERAFVTIDSGFPLTALEEALEKGETFTYPFPESRVPVLFNENDWKGLSTSKYRGSQSLVDILLHEPAVDRLYWALSNTDVETRNVLQRNPGLPRLLPYGPVLDFYGTQIYIRAGRVIVPGGTPAEAGWRELVGASPRSPGDFVLRLVDTDNGWLAVYFDTLARVDAVHQAHLTTSPRLRRLYEAFIEPDTKAYPARAVFRKAPALLMLFTRLQWDENGDPHVPGSLEVWKQVLAERSEGKLVRDWSRRARGWKKPEQLLEGMVALSRLDTDLGPLQTYLMLSAIDSRRPAGLTSQTVLLMAGKFPELSDWYLIFSEFPDLDDNSIAQFVKVADKINDIHDHSLRGNTMGMFQANLGIWQILARQKEIRSAGLNQSWQQAIAPFAGVDSLPQLFDAGQASLKSVALAAGGKADISQGELIDLLAGPPQQSEEGQRMRQEMAAKMHAVLEDQRLVSLDTLFTLGDGLNGMAKGAPAPANMLRLAGELREFELPRPIFTESEKTEWAPGVYANRHAELQVHVDITKVIKGPGSRSQLEGARGQLTPFLRDALVGLNYAYYEPPGAQLLHNNPLFVRSHDFSGETIMGVTQLWQASELFNQGSPAGGGAYLVGSLAELPYVLASTEEDFIAPKNVQALIWKEVAADLMVSATLPRWWNVSKNELHATALYQRAGEDLVMAAATNQEVRHKVYAILADRLPPQRLGLVEQAFQSGDAGAALAELTPADSFHLAAAFRKQFPQEAASWGAASAELDRLNRQSPGEVDLERISRDFGTPHPVLAQNYTCELLNVQPFPAFGGNSSRLLGESWDSSNLYWARLADEKGYSPVVLNRLVPELTRHMIANIFATDIEDWPALTRAMRETGEEFRQGKIALPQVAEAAPASQGSGALTEHSPAPAGQN
ncbi:MAG: hypothetical protein WA510_31410 [Acidobacteriaceae bacterium]